MGEIEKRSAKRRKKQDIQTAVLAVAATGVILSAAIIAPNILQVFAKLGVVGKRKKESIGRARDRLLEGGLLKRDDRGFLCITDRGILKLNAGSTLLQKPKRWDGKWRVLIFDIPEKRRLARDQIRHTLDSAGFVRLQDSVWVYPHNCEDFVALLKSNMRIGKDLLYMIADSIENDHYLKKSFGLETP